jgi:lipopolysaccharide/colanic/teichoic acid biosynthesis glycosyltransferase
MTGWAVVHGRNDVPISMRRELDTWYADHVGFALDLKILGKTIALIMRSQGINRARGPSQLSSEQGADVQQCSREN